jgi:hypothetical protein
MGKEAAPFAEERFGLRIQQKFSAFALCVKGCLE